MLPTAAVMLLGEKERPFSPTVTVWMLPAGEVAVLAVAVELEVSCGAPYWPSVKGRRGRRNRVLSACIVSVGEMDGG
jgi:hypothetical protein